MNFLTRRKRDKLRGKPFPAEWLRILRKRIPIHELMSPEDSAELHGHINIFIAEKQFEGCGGLKITDEHRVTIAAQACTLLLHRKTDYYPNLVSILVYPGTYFAPASAHIGAGVVTEWEDSRLGESWSEGSVVLSWEAVCEGAANPTDGFNVVFHEFAHQLDDENGGCDGAPDLDDEDWSDDYPNRYLSWSRVLNSEYRRLNRNARRGIRTVMDDYGTVNPAEFFAVATECFFEKPAELKKDHPKLFDELQKYYHQDPAAWFTNAKK